MKPLSPYRAIGLVLLVAGAIAAPVFYFVAESVPLTALGLSACLLGFVALLLDRSVPALPPRAAEMLLEAGLENLASLLEELGVEERAVYLPASLSGGRSRALIPLHLNSSRPAFTRPLPERLVVTYGSGPDDVGLLVTTPGSTAVGLLDGPPGSSSSEIEAALVRIIVGTLDVAKSVQAGQDAGTVTVRVEGPRLPARSSRTERVLGSPLASVAAALVAEALGRSMSIRSEERSGETLTIVLEPSP